MTRVPSWDRVSRVDGVEDVDLSELAFLEHLLREASVRKVAERLGSKRTTVSRRLLAIEQRLGEDLFLRRGKKLLLTRFGEDLLGKATTASDALRAFKAAAADAGAAAGARITVAAAPLFAELVLPEVLARFSVERPKVRVDVRLSQERARIFDERIDLALRRGPLEDSDSLIARRLGRTTIALVGGRSFVPPAEPSQLVPWLEGLPWIKAGTTLAPVDVHLPGLAPRPVRLRPIVAVDSQRLALDLVRRGLGVARLNAFLVREDLARGELHEVCEGLRSVEDVFAVQPRRNRPSAIVRDFVQQIVATTRALDLWDRG